MVAFKKMKLIVVAMLPVLAACTMGTSFKYYGAFGSNSTSNLSLSIQPAVSAPTSAAIVARLTKGLQNNVNPLTGNFQKALTQVQTNLPKVTDPTKATGFDQVQLLVYAACSDLTTGATPLMQSKYNVNPASSIATNQTNLVAAGVQMLDQYTAGLASKGSASTDVNSALASLVATLKADSTNTSKIAFMSVCIAANVTGSTMLGF